MFASVPVSHAISRAAAKSRPLTLAPAMGRLLLAAALLAGAAAGFLATGDQAASAATASAGRELTHLLRAMAGMKALFAAGAASVTYWRLGSPIGWPRLALYAAATASMAAGPGLIWDMADVKLGALLLHGGLLATILLLWRDPAMSARLASAIAVRRARLTR